MSVQQTTLLDCEYFPSINWYQNYINTEHALLEKHDFFERTSLRNRCYVCGPNGLIMLTVPLDGGRNQHTIMKDLKIYNDGKWQQHHWKTLKACYNRSPYFEFFEDNFRALFENKYNFLIDVNLDTIQTINQILKIDKQFSWTETYDKNHNENILDLRNQSKKNNTASHGLHYIQPFESKHGFMDGLSMLDMLFCCGRQAKELLSQHEK